MNTADTGIAVPDGFETFSLACLGAVWDNEEDAVYDDWETRYGVRPWRDRPSAAS